MTPIRMCCPYCSQVTHLAPGEIFLALGVTMPVTIWSPSAVPCRGPARLAPAAVSA